MPCCLACHGVGQHAVPGEQVNKQVQEAATQRQEVDRMERTVDVFERAVNDLRVRVRWDAGMGRTAWLCCSLKRRQGLLHSSAAPAHTGRYIYMSHTYWAHDIMHMIHMCDVAETPRGLPKRRLAP